MAQIIAPVTRWRILLAYLALSSSWGALGRLWYNARRFINDRQYTVAVTFDDSTTLTGESGAYASAS